MGCGRRLCCIRGCALRSAQPRPYPEPARAAFSAAAAPARRAAPPGETRVRASFPGLTDFRGAKNSASVPASIWTSVPLLWRLPHPVGARAHSHTLPLAGARSRQRPPAEPTLSGAATHTGFQPPRGVLCLRRRQQRERQRQPGPVSQRRARDGVREKRGRRTPRRGGDAPRPAPGSKGRAASAPGPAAPDEQLRGPQHPSLGRPGLKPGLPGPAPAQAPGQRLRGEWAVGGEWSQK